jgi:hypothetical protein
VVDEDADPAPRAFVAVTLTVYVMPLVNPVSEHGLDAAVHVLVGRLPSEGTPVAV